MANSTSEIQMGGIGQDGRRYHVPVKTSQTIYAGNMVSQQLSDGLLVPTTAAGAGPCIGKATHTVTAATAGQRMVVESDRIYTFANGSGGDAFSEASLIGAPAYAFDDHTVYDNSNAGVLQACGTFEGMEPDGKVRVKLSSQFAGAVLGGAVGGPPVQYGSGTFAAGVLTVTGVTLTATSVIVATRKTEAGTDGDEVRIPSADRTVGALGTGQFTARAFSAGAAATSDTSTFDWIIVG
jgi:hypothetical protein